MKIKLTTETSTSSYGQPMFVIDGDPVDYYRGIKALRKQEGLSTKQLAEICGVSARTVEDWEQGRRSPSKSAMMLLAAWLKEKENKMKKTFKLETIDQCEQPK